MLNKICTICNTSKPKDDFAKSKNICKLCASEQTREWAKQNPEAIKQHRKKYYNDNIDSIKAYRQQYYQDNKKPPKQKIVVEVTEKQCNKCFETKLLKDFAKSGTYIKNQCKKCVNLQSKKFRDENPEYAKQYRDNNLELWKHHRKKDYEKNRDSILEKKKEYYIINKETIVKNVCNNIKRRIETDPLYKFIFRSRTLIRNSLMRAFTKKSKKTIEYLGCDFETFKKHIQDKFDQYMSWDNYGSYWHLDHIIPISTAKNEKEAIELNHYTNFQPLEKMENIRKGNKLNYKYKDPNKNKSKEE